ncbi:sodium:calcium antiporter [Desulfitobacterium sp.]|uniref:sodium:calcium antiporter n=1 Tax=Desulfitobacterium sp. TaxID=49981 RepID=UPI002B807B1F|nr:sodium:calcium antiporter [Desulfitobacterium sp.]HVJ49811.1 sodium:calcium antiporter [Desulfitobacterium sp.]
MKDAVIMLSSLGLILASAEAFTNGVEWLGNRLHLGAGAVGSVLAAVGTALPETMVPLIAFLGTQGEGEITEVGIGAILGAPFMLTTLAFFISGLAALFFRRSNRPLKIQGEVIRRDISFFLVTYTLAIISSFLPSPSLKLGIAGILPLIYILYVIITVRQSRGGEEQGQLSPLYLARQAQQPELISIMGQITLALLGIVVGAHGFVDAVQSVALTTGIPALVLSLIITPIATELPEKFNSVIWLSRGKDTLALGNITGAMVFQSSMIPAIGIALTPWNLEPLALLSGLLALASALIPFMMLRRRGEIYPVTLLAGGGFYLLFILTVLKFL